MAKEYIEREAVKAVIKKRLGTMDLFESRFNADIDAMPAADVVEVPCMCKDCKHRAIVGGGYRWCKAWERIQTMGDDGYCCFGERKE